MDLFEKSARLRIRFPSSRGNVSAEDLWDLPVEELDDIFKNLNAQLKTAQEESLLDTRSKVDEVSALQIDIIKHIVETKLAEADERLSAVARKEQKQKLLGILATKRAAALENLSEAEIEAKLAELG